MFTKSPAVPPLRTSAATVAIGVAIHGILWFLLFVVMLIVVPRYERLFSDFKMKLPDLTVRVLAASAWCRQYWYVVALIAVPLLSGDGILLFLIGRSPHRWPGRIWLGLWIALPLLAGALVALSIMMPLAQLQEGLSS